MTHPARRGPCSFARGGAAAPPPGRRAARSDKRRRDAAAAVTRPEPGTRIKGEAREEEDAHSRAEPIRAEPNRTEPSRNRGNRSRKLRISW